ncbi:MAG: DUF4465 domain-containing protein [Prevotellaceae bacterium]|jgi:hypothetical protein|nr:DUF4465 domain-containing protein [Prevotellaceae bacterium]
MKRYLLLLITTLFLCADVSYSQTLNESFEGSTFPPSGWQHNKDADNGYGWARLTSSPSRSISAPQDGSYFAEFESYYTPKDKTAELVTPHLDLTKGITQLSFYSVATSGGYGMHVDVSTDNGATWTDNVYTVTKGETEWTLHTVDLSAYSTFNKVLVRFKAASSYGSGKCNTALDNIIGPHLYVSTTPPDPTTVVSPENNADDIYSTVTIKWNETAFTSGYKLYVGTNTEATNLHNGIDLGNVTSYTLKNLTWSQTYYWRIVPYNDNGDAENTPIWSFTVMDNPTVSTFPWNENFNGTAIPLAWQVVDNNNDGKTWEFSTTNGVDGSGCVMTTYASSANDWLVTPPITPQSGVLFTFMAKSGSSWSPYKINVKLSTSSSAIEDFTVDLGSDVSVPTSFTKFSYDLSAYVGSTVYIAFQVTGSNYVYIDDISAYIAEDITYENSKAYQEITDEISIGSSNNPILKVVVSVTGEVNPPALTSLSFNLNGTTNVPDITKVAVYYTGSSDNFSTATLFGELSNPTSTFTITGNQKLPVGNNIFWLACDIDAGATAENIIDAEFTGVTVDGQTHIPEVTAPTGSRVLKHTLKMPSGVSSHTVTETLIFYDDGGKDANYSNGFEGTITFVPSEVGKKIQINWNSFEVFHNTSNPANNDIFRVYNGSSVDPAELIDDYYGREYWSYTGPKNIPTVTKSAADNGALTIYFKVNTGVPWSGWEAEVLHFVPENMVYNGTETAVASTETLTAGNTNEAILIFNIKTTNTLSPFEVESLSFDASGTTTLPNISKAKVYFLGKKNEFSTANLFGELSSIGSNIYTITGTQSQRLVEGNSYFALVYDIAETALNDDVVAAKLTSIKLSGTDHAVTTSEVGSREVYNIFKALGGTHTRIMYGSWVYTDTKSPYSSTKYDYEDKDCIITFTPAQTGAVAEIDFSRFDVYYSSSSYGTKATFEVYSGTTMNSENILWKLDSNEKSQTGPQKKLRSTAADGSITIKFNAKTTTSSYAGTGWEANVTPFVNHNMTVEEVTAFQNNTSNIKPSATNQEIIGVEIVTEGTLTAAIAKEFKVDLKGSLESINKVTILYSSEEKDFSQGVEFGSISDPATQQVTVVGTQTLPEGKSYFWLSYDTKSDIESDVQIDAALLSVKVDDTDHTPDTGDPDGYRLTKNTIELAQGDNGTITLTKSMMFYDDGGPENEYSLNFDGTITFTPSAIGQVVKMNFNDFRTYSSHYFFVYSGTEVDDDKLIAKLSSNTNIPERLLGSLADGGAVTVRFVSTSSGTLYQGWAIEVSSYTPLDLFVESITTSQVGLNTILRGSGKEPVQKVVVKVGGDEGSLSVNQLKFTAGLTTNESDIKTARLYYTEASSGFIANNQFGSEVSSSSMIFEKVGGEKITAAGEYYFWLTYDIEATASVGNKIGAELTSILIDITENTGITEENTVERIIKSGFKGTYIIGKSSESDYATFAEAITAMSGGIEGAVIFKVEAGTYSENIKISGIQGTSEENTITFTSLSGKNNDVTINGSGYSEPPYGETKYGMFVIESTSHVTIENMSLIPTSQAYPYNIHLYNMSRYFTLRNCILKANLVTSGYDGMRMVYTQSINEEGQNNDYYTIENNTITGGYIALYLGGTSYVRLTKERGVVIRNNTINNSCGKGIYITDVRDVLVENNTVISETTQKTDYQAMDIYRCKDNVIIRNNKIVNKQAYYSRGIQLRSEVEGTAEKTVLVYNNSISIINSPNNSSYGISITGDCSYIHLYYNSIRISGGGGYVLGTASGSATIPLKNIVIKNNLLQSHTTAPVYYFYKQTDYQNIDFSNNAYKFTGTNFAAGPSSWTSDYTNWLAISNESSSIIEEAEFFTDTDLHLKAAGNLNVGLPLSFITTDISGTERSTTAPTIGAYEYIPFTIDTPEMEDGYPIVESVTHNSAALKVKLTQPGKLYSIIKLTTEVAPTEVELEAMEPVNIDLAQAATITFTGLTELTEYKAYFYMESIFNMQSVVMESAAFTTTEEIFPMVVNLPPEWDWVTAGTSVTINPTVTGGVPPYQYTWKNAKGEIISTEATITVNPTIVSQYVLNVKDSNIEDQTWRTVVWVDGEKKIATFEDLYLESESYWRGYSYGYRAEDEDLYGKKSVFYSGSYSFSNTYGSGYWADFGYSNVTATDFNPAQFLTHQFRSVTGKGVAGSATFGVSFASDNTEVIVMHDMLDGDIVDGVYLTNSAYTMNTIKNGDPYGVAFKKGDWYKVIFKGMLNGSETSTIECYLADYRSADESEHYALEDWEWFDLSHLGKVTSIKISVDGSRRNSGGLTIPAYFCSDNWGSPAPQALDVNSVITIEELTDISATLKVTVDKEGKLYKLIHKTDETAPTATEVLAADSYVEMSINVPLDIIFTSLSPSTEYKAYFVLVDENDNQTEVIESLAFTTSNEIINIVVTQALQSVDDVTAIFEVSSTHAGKLYHYIQESSVPMPSIQTVLSGGYVSISENIPVTVNFTGLTHSTEYKAYFVVISTDGYRSELSSSSTFTTDREEVTINVSINGQPWDIENTETRYIVNCGESGKVSIVVSVPNSYMVLVNGSEMPSGTFTVNIDKPSIKQAAFTVKSRVDDYEEDHVITIEKYFSFEDIIIQRWNNTLLVNNNSSTNGGYSFTGYKWYKNGIQVGSEQFYSAGTKKTDILEPSAEYYIEVTTSDGQVLRTCAERVILKEMGIKAYPSPVSANSIFTIETNLDNELLQNAVVEIYSIMGVRISSSRVQGEITRLAAPSSPGTYIVIVKSGNFSQEQKILVK